MYIGHSTQPLTLQEAIAIWQNKGWRGGSQENQTFSTIFYLRIKNATQLRSRGGGSG